MRRVVPLLLLVLLLAACGSAHSGGGAGGGAPAPADLAADALAALAAAGSAHYLVDASMSGNAADGFDGSVRLEGDASADAFTADGTVTFGGASFSGKALAGRDELFLQFMGQWYGDREVGLGQADEETPSVEEVREYFDQVFTGSVSEGPDLDGAATWGFEGKLNAEGFADLTERFDHEVVTAKERELLHKLADHTHFILDVGREDHLPRHLEFTLEVSGQDAAELGSAFGGSELGGLLDFDIHAAVDLSQFGEDVSYEAPRDYRPLDELFDELFKGLE
jgi:hypothetical protein